MRFVAFWPSARSPVEEALRLLLTVAVARGHIALADGLFRQLRKEAGHDDE